jgi:hypothetical protein
MSVGDIFNVARDFVGKFGRAFILRVFVGDVLRSFADLSRSFFKETKTEFY